MGHTAEQTPVEFAKRGITTVSEAKPFFSGKQSTGNFSIRGLPLSRKQSLFLSLPQKI